jgi:hypothetical protein
LGQPFAGTDPMLILVGFCMGMALVFLIIMLSMQSANKKIAAKNQLCIVVMKNRHLDIKFLPIMAGKITAPPYHKFDENKERAYFTNRKYSLDTPYPPLVPKILSMIQVTSWASLYEEGDSRPILPDDEIPIDTPETTQAMIQSNLVPQVLNSLSRFATGGQGGGGLALGKNKTLIIFIAIICIAAILASAFFGYKSYEILSGGI